MPTCSKGKALFENHDTLFIERMVGVPHPIAGYDQRWIDNFAGLVVARNARFGGEGGGFTVVVNKASFLTTDPSGMHWSERNASPPGRGPLPPGTTWEGDPQHAAIILDSCQIDSDGSKERQANIWLEQLPAILVSSAPLPTACLCVNLRSAASFREGGSIGRLLTIVMMGTGSAALPGFRVCP